MDDPSTPQRRPPGSGGKDLTTVQRVLVCSELKAAEHTGVRGVMAKVLRSWQIGKSTGHRLRQQYEAEMAHGGEPDMSRKKRSGRPSSIEADWAGIVEALPPKRRKSWRRWAQIAGISLSTCWRWAKQKGFKGVTVRLKPKLSEQHKLARMSYVLQQVVDIEARHPVYKDLFDRLHIDEKHFHLMPNGRTLIVGPGEELPAPTVKHKSHIPKAMFISVIGRPHAALKFDGLVCVHSCTKLVAAKRNSKNRAAGELQEVDVSVDAAYYRETMVDVILPAIVQALPRAGLDGRRLTIQHDGAPAHNGKGNQAFWPVMLKEKYPTRDIIIITQPAQSPDLNINDLGFFNSLQSLADKTDADSLSDLLDAVEECYWEYDPETLERVWQAQFNTYNCILKARGGNNFKQPHTGVSKRQRRGQLAVRVKASRVDIEACRALVGM